MYSFNHRSHHHKHHHHHHHHRGRHSTGDLLSRTRIGSHIALEDLAGPTAQIPTEPEEAANLNMADLEDMAGKSCRMFANIPQYSLNGL